MAIVLKFACGHRLELSDAAMETAPRCPECKERRISTVLAPPPVFRARDCAITGPLVQE